MESSLTDRKKALFDIINPWLQINGFNKIKHHIPLTYIKLDNEKVIILGFEFKIRSDFHTSSPFMIHFMAVEEIILEIKTPINDYSNHIQGEDFTITVQKDFSVSYEEKFSKLDLKTVEGFEQWGHLILEYMEGEGKAFMEHYSYLPNVLKEMDRLEAEGKYWKEILVAGSPIWFFRGLIISKLCNDINFSSKKKWVDIFFNDAQYELEEWLPYYEKLKKRLETLEPIYNPY